MKFVNYVCVFPLNFPLNFQPLVRIENIFSFRIKYPYLILRLFIKKDIENATTVVEI